MRNFGSLKPLVRQIILGISLGILSYPNALYSFEKPREELMVVQTVSKNQRSFVVTRGLKDGVFKNQEAIFSNDTLSILCKAQEVNRDYSLWVPIDRNINIPFKKEDFVSYNSHAYGNVALDVVGDVNNIIEPNYNELYKKFRTSNNISLKGSLNRGITQSSSDVSTEKNTGRVGYAFAGEYNYRFMPEFEMSLGGRYDNEVYRLTNPALDIPTTRVMATLAATYHLMNFTSDKNNFYLSIAAGIGKSETTIGDEKTSGTVTILPEVRIGYLMTFSKSVAMIFETSIESLSANEKFADETQQVTNIVNMKFTVGLRF